MYESLNARPSERTDKTVRLECRGLGLERSRSDGREFIAAKGFCIIKLVSKCF